MATDQAEHPMSETLSKPTLPTFSWVGHLKRDDRELLSSYGEFFPGHPGNVIIEEGVVQTEVFVVISGELEVYAHQEDGTKTLLARVGPGETIGEISLFNPGPAAATVVVTEFSQLWRIADHDLIEFMEENPGAGNVLLRTLASILAQRLRQLNPKAFGLSAYAVVDSPELVKGAPLPVTEIPDEVKTTTFPTPAPVAAVPDSLPVEPPVEVPPGTNKKKLSTKTQVVPDPDELEPL
jgi:CRP-like cAMP-binding protein